MKNDISDKSLAQSAEFKRRFDDEINQLTIARTNYATTIAAFLYFSFLALDWFTVPSGYFIDFFVIRLLVLLNFLLSLVLLNNSRMRPYVIWISVWIIFISIFGVILMTTYLGGFGSNYYIGIMFILFFPAIFVAWTVPATLVCGLASLVAYILLNFTLGHNVALGLEKVLGPIFFIGSTVLITAFANYEKMAFLRRNLLLHMQIEQANNDLQELDRTKMRFFANVSHELRTPLTLILGPMEQLQEHDLDENARGILRAMEANAHRLLRQVNALLDFAKIDAQHLTCNYEKSNVGKILDELIASSIPFARQKSILLTAEGTDKLPVIEADNEKLETIFANILSNALKFTPAGGKISVSVGFTEAVVWVECTDTGVGIPADQLPTIFDRFQQVDDSYTSSYQGTGLGLALVRELVKIHGGHIDVSSIVNKGSTFRVEIPRKADYQYQERRKTPGRRRNDKIAQERINALTGVALEQHRRKKTLFADAVEHTGLSKTVAGATRSKLPALAEAQRLLVVEDNADLRAFLINGLNDKYRVFEAENGRLGLVVASRVNPDLIISDIMMPEMDGYAFVKALREDQSLARIPVILVTSRSGAEAVEEGLKTGANDYVAKPFEMRELRARIDAQLRLRYLERGISEQETRLIAVGQMTSSVVHDFASPLTTILGLAQLTQMEAETSKEKKIVELQEAIAKETNRLIRLRADILEFARGYTKSLETEQTNLAGYIETIANLHTEQLQKQDIELITRHAAPANLEIDIDRDQMKRVLENLIRNARESFFGGVEASDREKCIWLTTAFDDGKAIIRVADNGRGIPDDQIEKIFQPFASNGKKKGTGLGLAIVRNLVKAHNGSIDAEGNASEGGAAFVIRLPASGDTGENVV
jgi:signal transduction histidine kinase